MKRLNYVFFCLTAFFMAVGVMSLNAQDITHPVDGTTSFTVTQGTSVMYYDNGGADCDGTGEEYVADSDGTAVICPDAAGSTITIEFLDVDVETRTTSPCWDFIRVYDGDNTGATLLFEGCGEEGFQSCSGFPGDGGDGGGVEGGVNDIDGSNDATPVNNVFTSTAGNGCLTVNFTSDGSVHDGGWVATVSASATGGGPTCDDGMQNGDETGVDCGGATCPPCMSGPTCDDGMQNGDEEGVDCGGSSCPPCEAACQEFTLDIDFDNFSGETSWEVTDLFGNLVDNEDYSSGLDATSETLCLDPGCYEFTIFDSFGDGICCGFGLGSWSLSDDGGEIASGGEFGSSESAFFCTDPGPGCVPASATASVVSYCSNGVFMVQVTVSDLGSASTLAIGNSGGLPFLQNVFFPRTYYVGPFPIGTDVDIFVFDTENSACITMLPGLTDACSGSLVPNTGEAFGGASVFPNPTTGEVNVNLGSFIGKSVSIEVYNAVGQMIEARQVNDIQTPTERFDLSQQESGIYYIHMNVDGQENIIERVVLSARP